MMRKTLLAATMCLVSVLVASVTARAKDVKWLPAEMMGTWCPTDARGEATVYGRDCYGNPKVGDDIIVIGSDGYKDGGVTVCKNVSISTRNDYLYTVRLRCRDEGGPAVNQTMRMWMRDGNLFIQ
jgi:hypothetical protein